MAEPEHDPRAVWAYRRALGEIAERRVVHDAEDAVARAWISELEDIRRRAVNTVAEVRLRARAAREDLRAAQRDGGPRETGRAHERLAAIEAEQALALEHAQALLSFARAELDHADRSGAARSRQVQQDYERLRAAWSRAFAE